LALLLERGGVLYEPTFPTLETSNAREQFITDLIFAQRRRRISLVNHFVQPWRSHSRGDDGYPIGEDFINEGRGFSPTHLKFFLLVFSQIKRSQREDQA